MRILVHGMVGNNLGGIETFLLNMNDFMTEDCIFDYVIEEDVCIHEERIRKKGGRIYKVRSRVKSPIGNTIDIIKLYREHKHEYKIIYYNLSSLSWIMPEIIARFRKLNVVVHAHNATLIGANSGFLHCTMNRMNKQIITHMKITRLACSRYASEFMFGSLQSTIIYNGIDVEKYRFSTEYRQAKRNLLNISDSDLVLGCVARLVPEKNILFLLDVFEHLVADDERYRLILIGDGSQKEIIEERIISGKNEQRIYLLGNVKDVYAYMSCFDVYVFPSANEGLGITLIEAQASGLTCLVKKEAIPKETYITDLITVMDTFETEKWKVWLSEGHFEKIDGNKRERYNDIVGKSAFDIRKNAGFLEQLLRNK